MNGPIQFQVRWRVAAPFINMTVAELIERLQREKPGLEVRLWDTKASCFTDRFYLQSAALDEGLLMTPTQPGSPSHMGSGENWSGHRDEGPGSSSFAS